MAALVEGGDEGRWAAEQMLAARLVAPYLMPVEVANVLQRAATSGAIGDDAASLAFAEVGSLAVTLVEFAPLAARVWQLRSTVSAYDAWYVAAAEALGADLVTLDLRLARAPGVLCSFRLPPGPTPPATT